MASKPSYASLYAAMTSSSASFRSTVSILLMHSTQGRCSS